MRINNHRLVRGRAPDGPGKIAKQDLPEIRKRYDASELVTTIGGDGETTRVYAYRIVEGPQRFIGDIRFEGNTHLSSDRLYQAQIAARSLGTPRETLRRAGKLDQAIGEAKKLVESDPKEISFRGALANLLIKKPDYEGAIQQFAKPHLLLDVDVAKTQKKIRATGSLPSFLADRLATGQ